MNQAPTSYQGVRSRERTSVIRSKYVHRSSTKAIGEMGGGDQTLSGKEDAARAYDNAARQLRCVNARTNFELSHAESDSILIEKMESFSFDAMWRTEEPEGLIDALKAKLSKKESSQVRSIKDTHPLTCN
ncbi:ethylene-responsive transcription factor Related to AP22-12-like [Forsythia ovata]|uniref:Ethylene-responsive transcription factor Related to AP22-12-like n=1 Tax=Forsythia ovata TaxID=205694 RepID=A0ABD1R0L0_9LAMI